MTSTRSRSTLAGVQLQPKWFYRLLISGNLNQWTSIATNTADAAGRAVFPQPRSSGQSFYCVVTP
jgi:hypothetical protein